MKRIGIAHQSDLCLIVQDKVDLRVSSAALCNNSNVFKAMLGSRWAEGQALLGGTTSSSPPQVPLTEDDADSMATVAMILHHRNDLLPETISAAELADVAQLGDKYDCIVAMKHAASYYFTTFSDSQVSESPISIAKAAYYFNDASQFARATSLAVREAYMARYAGFDSTPDLHGLQGLLQFPIGASSVQTVLKVLCVPARLNAAELQALDSIQLTAGIIGAFISKHMVKGHIEATPASSLPGDFATVPSARGRGGRGGRGSWTPISNFSENRTCVALMELATVCLHELRQSGIWLSKEELKSTRFGLLLKMVKRLDMPKASSAIAVQPCDDAMCLQRCQIFLNKVNEEVKDLKHKASEMFTGICLDCFNANGRFEGECRIKHEK